MNGTSLFANIGVAEFFLEEVDSFCANEIDKKRVNYIHIFILNVI